LTALQFLPALCTSSPFPLSFVYFFGRGTGIDFPRKDLLKATVANDFKEYKDKQQQDAGATFLPAIYSGAQGAQRASERR